MEESDRQTCAQYLRSMYSQARFKVLRKKICLQSVFFAAKIFDGSVCTNYGIDTTIKLFRKKNISTLKQIQGSNLHFICVLMQGGLGSFATM